MSIYEWYVPLPSAVAKQDRVDPQETSWNKSLRNWAACPTRKRMKDRLKTWSEECRMLFSWRAVTVVYCRTVPELVTVGLFTPSNLQTWQLKGSGMACALLQMEISTRSQAWSNLKKWTFTEERCVVRNYADSWRADVELGLCMLHTWHDLNTA